MVDYALETQNLSRDYGSTKALHALDWRVPPGRLTALLGPNGAGKTTLFNVLAGQIAPTEGHAKILGTDCTRDFDTVTGRVASLLDTHEPPIWATVNELLRLECEAMPNFNADHARALFDGRGIDAKKRYEALSKGQRRWVRASLALASGAEVLLLDEPADGMDPEARRLLYDALRDLVNDQGVSVVVATHIIHDIERVADDVAILRRGELLLHDSLEELRERVREVEMEGEPPPEGLHDATVLQSMGHEGGTRLLLRMDNGDRELKQLFGQHLEMRPVNLESLYLSLTTSASGDTP
jgi:ABC-2 type transport system ATP-binding protein